MTKRMAVGELKRDFSKVLDAAEQGEQTIVLRHGKPVAIIVPVTDDGEKMESASEPRPAGLLTALGLFSDWETMEEDMAKVIAERHTAIDRPAPTFD